ncbi:MAG TPA: hypothetical protein DEB52_16865 [Hyphomonas sp.]|jgi:hypothetical protein|nr:hypothetical protein [Hyphomonas sp.]
MMTVWEFMRMVAGSGAVSSPVGSFMVLGFDAGQGGWLGESCRGRVSHPTERLAQAVNVLMPVRA